MRFVQHIGEFGVREQQVEMYLLQQWTYVIRGTDHGQPFEQAIEQRFMLGLN